jgi:hypothetical protein
MEDIAIIGMGCRFPGGSNDPYTFFTKLKQGILNFLHCLWNNLEKNIFRI